MPSIADVFKYLLFQSRRIDADIFSPDGYADIFTDLDTATRSQFYFLYSP